MKTDIEAVTSDGRMVTKSYQPFSKWVMADNALLPCKCGDTPSERGEGEDYHIVCPNWLAHKSEPLIFGEKSEVGRIWNNTMGTK